MLHSIAVTETKNNEVKKEMGKITPGEIKFLFAHALSVIKD